MRDVLGLMRLSIKSRLLVIMTGTAVLALLLASASFFAYDAATFRDKMVRDQVTLTETLHATLATAVVYNDPELVNQILSGLEKQVEVEAAAVYDADGERVGQYSRGEVSWPSRRPAEVLGSGHRFGEDSLLVYRDLIFGERKVGLMALHGNLEELRDRRAAYGQILALVILGVSLIAFLVASYLQRSVSVPISRLAKVAREVSLRKDFSLRAHRLGDDEIAGLTDDFNHMLGQIEERDEELRQARDLAEQANRSKSVFLASMSHELRTPLTAIIGYSEFLEDDAAEMGLEDFLPDLQKIKSAGKHLLGLINSILDLSKVEAGKMELYLEDFEVDELVREVATTVRPLMERKGNQLDLRGLDGLSRAEGDLTKTRQILFNLLS
ncbi:MAG: HAMP domain-containing protein, partial [Holophagales bacterium]|nr:HAMP domain-containing protein [Holophagales bacterium]